MGITGVIKSSTFNGGRFGSNSGRVNEVSTSRSFHDLEQRRDRKGSVHTTHTRKSHSRGGSHLSHEKNNEAM